MNPATLPSRVLRLSPVLVAAGSLLAGALQAASPPGAASVALPPSLSAAGHSFAPVVSASGRQVAFLSHAPNLVTNDDLAPHLDLFLRDLAGPDLVLVSVNTNGTGGANENVALATLSADGGRVAFETAASNLVPHDTNGLVDIFVRDIAAGVTRLVSKAADGTGSGNGRSFQPLISADGRYVIFESTAANLVTNDFNGTNDVFVHDLETGLTRLVSLDAEGTASGDGASHSPAISSNGLFVAFVSHATNIAAGVTNRLGEIFVRDLAGNTNRWAMAGHLNASRSRADGSYQPRAPKLDADGRFVLFQTGAGTLVRFDTHRATNAQSTVIFTPGSVLSSSFPDNPRYLAASPGGLANSPPAFTPDGRFAAYTTGTNGGGAPYQVVLRADFEQLSTNVTSSICCGGAPPTLFINTNIFPTLAVVSTNYLNPTAHENHAYTPVMSADGNRILFLSAAWNVPTPPPPDGSIRLFLRDMNTNVVLTVSTNRSGSSAALAHDVVPALSPDGTLVAWESSDDDIVDGDFNACWDIFARRLDRDETVLVSQAHPARAPRTGRGIATVGEGGLSGDGRRLAFLQRDSGLRRLGTNRWTDAVLRDFVAGTNLLLSPGFTNTVGTAPPALPLGTNSGRPRLSAEGRYALFQNHGPDVYPTNLLWRDLAGRTNRVLAAPGPGRASMSADGRVVAFEVPYLTSVPAYLGDDGNSAQDIVIFVPDRLSQPQPAAQFLAISTASNTFLRTANAASIQPRVSADGRWVAFQSLASDITPDPDPLPASFQLFVFRLHRNPTNTVPGQIKLVSYNTVASPNPGGTSTEEPLAGGATNAAFSGDGRWLFFEVPGDRSIQRHDLERDVILTVTQSTNQVARTNRARLTNLVVCANCTLPSPDFSGRWVAFESPAGSNVTRQIWLRDLVTGSNELISVAADGTSHGNASSFEPALSLDARFVVFTSRADNLVAGDRNDATDVFARDRWTQSTICLSRNRDGTGPGNGPSSHPVLAPDGRSVAFQSFASDLVEGDYNNTRDVFVVSLAGADLDADGLEDDWERAWFGTLARDGAGDFDGDGSIDAEEFRAGTGPTDTNSALRMLSLGTTLFPPAFAPLQQQTVVTWSTVPGRTYRLQGRGAVEAPWEDLSGDIPGAGATATRTETLLQGGPASPHREFRVRLVE